MSGIVAIERDPERQTLLSALIREHAQVEVTLVDSVKAAIASFEQQQPELIVAPTLLSPDDSEQLASYVKQHAEPHVQMLTIPALDLLRELPEDYDAGFRIFKRWRPARIELQYDPVMVGRQIAERLERARTLREEHTIARECGLVLRDNIAAAVRPSERSAPRISDAPLRDRRWAERSPQRALPWLHGVRLPWGSDVDLVNISSTGVLLESGCKLSPGVTLELQLSGMGLNRIVLAKFVRSEIARVDRLGVRYHAAAQFEHPLDILPPRTVSTPEPTRTSAPQLLAQLLTSVLADSTQPEPPSIRFARGLRDLIGAGDVLLRRTPLAPVDECESIYFSVNGDTSGTILQIVFSREQAPTATEFRLLKAASSLAAAVLELEHLPNEGEQPNVRSMAEVA